MRSRPAAMLLAATLAVSLPACGDSADPAPSTGPATAAAPSSSIEADVPQTSTTEAPGPSMETVHFQSGRFYLVGDLSLPGGAGPHPALVLVHSGGEQTRHSTPASSLTARKFRDAGYAVLTWDKPGSGESTGDFTAGRGTSELASILADGIDLLVQDSRIDSNRIGVWGLSEGGWVMPMALPLTDHIAFMIVVSGGGEEGVEQTFGYQMSQSLICKGGSAEDAALVDLHGPRAFRAQTYEQYREAIEAVIDIPQIQLVYPVQLVAEEDWAPLPVDDDTFVDPMITVGAASIPILAVFGELDKQVDPIKGVEAFTAAIEDGHRISRVELIAGVGHLLQEQETGCLGELGGAYSPRYLEILDEWIAALDDL